MVQKLDLFVEVMASANCSSSSLGKRKQRNDFVSAVNTKLEVETTDLVGNATQIPSGLTPIRFNPSCRSETENKFEEEECCVTPKSEEHKIPSMTVCPPASRKPKSAPLKRNPAIISRRRAIHVPSDSPDLELLFGSDLTKDHQHQKKKHKKNESSSSKREESQN
ncbi:hypothetical protein SUGI_0185180 [Cryptomeria japonica]|uniref:uncharacterized protein LOC131051555 n=1 Tax=Cryptomeria japonica TaxID=3369 RepID=UPI002408EE74|nr:uncharacterized protein LOC131051555 [Cryptomeria japonica]GLJ12135.1 hypothetical protein SUGI_0185180 [Cryptomeria japonica]